MYRELEAAAKACEDAAAEFDRDPLDALIRNARTAAQSLERSSSQSWAGYQARCYWRDFETAEAPFNIEWGINGNPYSQQGGARGWREYTAEAVQDEILRRAGVGNVDPLLEAANRCERLFSENRRETLTTLDAAISGGLDPALKEARDRVAALEDHIPMARFVRARQPPQVITRDRRVQFEGATEAPPHIVFEAEVMSRASYAGQLRELADLANTAALYLKKREQLSRRDQPTKPNPVIVPSGETTPRERAWDLWMLGAFVLGAVAGRFGETSLGAIRDPVLRAVKGLPPTWKAMLVGLAVAAALTLAAVVGNLVASLIDRDGRGILRVMLQRTRVRVLIAVAILLTAVAQALTQL
jgi:hypothetical protein